VQLLRCLIHYFYMCALWVASYMGQCVCGGVHVGICLCVFNRESDMPFEVTLVAQMVKAALPVGLS
jgi:hypothetical protein